MQSIYRDDEANLILEGNSTVFTDLQGNRHETIVITKITWKDLECELALSVETNVFPAELGMEGIGTQILLDLIYAESGGRS